MRRTCNIAVLTSWFVVAAGICHAQPVKADKPAPPPKKPAMTSPQLFSTLTLSGLVPPKPPATVEKLLALREHLGRALDITVDLLSGNKAALFSGNSVNLLSGNTPKILSENQTPIFSGNKFSLFSNIKVEIHIENSGNGAGTPPAVKTVSSVSAIGPPAPFLTPRPAPTYTSPTPAIAPSQPILSPSTPQEGAGQRSSRRRQELSHRQAHPSGRSQQAVVNTYYLQHGQPQPLVGVSEIVSPEASRSICATVYHGTSQAFAASMAGRSRCGRHNRRKR